MPPRRFRVSRRAQASAITSTSQSMFFGRVFTATQLRAGLPVKLIEGDYTNIKVTTAEDLALVERFLELRDRRKGSE